MGRGRTGMTVIRCARVRLSAQTGRTGRGCWQRPLGMSIFNASDAFAVGLGLDLAGGYLVAGGLLLDDADIATSRTFSGSGARLVVSKVRDRIDARHGLAALGAGVALQLTGYLAAEAGAQTAHTGLPESLVFVALAVLAVAFVLCVHRWLLARSLRRLSLRVMSLDGQGLQKGPPDGRDLMQLGVELGDHALPGETYGDYASRVWKIANVANSDQMPDDPGPAPRQAGPPPPGRETG
jgi:hypothetical protein